MQRWPVDICESIGLFYDIENGGFIDENGTFIWNVFEIITPSELYLFREYGKNMIVRHRQFKEVDVELYYPDDGWDED